MEARLAKVWIVGLQYDGCKIKTGDQRYDYTVPINDGSGIPMHALYTLRNGGGKGVFLQSIFQPLDPLASWKDHKNKVIHFFHNSSGKPVEYTLHIIEEWQISDTKKMMIGISICPKASHHQHFVEKELLIELDYILFSKIYTVDSNYDIYQLPLWDESTQESLPLNEWKKFLSTNSEIELYTSNRKNDYIQLLEENGLDQQSISLMKTLNICEGNISGFFKGSTDNIGLFHDKIIPTINNKIEDIDHDNENNISNITTSFLETLKVAKELPILLSTIRSIEELDEFTSPLINMYEYTYELQKSEKYFKDKGKEIYTALNTIHQEKLNYKSIKMDDYNKLSKDINRLEWRKQNLRYIEELKKTDSLDKQYHDLSAEFDSIEQLLETTKSELRTSKINLLLKKAHLCSGKIHEIQFNLDLLEKNYDLDELKQKLAEIKIYFQDNWESIKENWKSKVTLNYRMDISYTNNINTINDSINTEDILNREIDNSINRLNEKITNHLNKQETVIKLFGEKARSFLDDVIFAYESHCATYNDAIADNNEKIKQSHADIENIQNDLGSLDNKIISNQEFTLILSDKLKKNIEKENEIIRNASSLLKENIEDIYSRSDYEILKNKITLLKEEQEEKLNKYNRKLLELEIEMNLIDEGKSSNIYVANKDLVKLKKLLDENQIPNMYGTYFLKQCNHEEQIFNLKRNPALPFSVVILKEEFENVDLSFLREELFSSMIILVDGLKASKLIGYNTINPSLQKISEIDYIPIDKTFELITDEYEFNKRNTNIKKKFDDILFEIDEKKQLLAKIDSLLSSVDIIFANKLSRELEKEIADLNQLIQDLIIKRQTLNCNLKEARLNITSFGNAIIKLSTELNIKHEQVTYLHQWKEECETYLKYNQELADFNTRLEKSTNRLAKLQNESKILNEQYQSNKNAFSKWLRFAKQDFNDLLSLLGDISFPTPIIVNDFSEDNYLKLISFGNSIDKVHYEKLTIYKNLLIEKSNRNSIIGNYISSLKSLNNELAKYQEKLETLNCLNWHDSAEPIDDLQVLDKISNDLDIKVRNLENNIFILNTNISNNNKQRSDVGLNVIKIKDELTEDYPEYGAVKFEIADIDGEREKIRILKKDTINDQKTLRKNIDYLDIEIKKIYGLLVNFSALHITSSSKDTLLTNEERNTLLQDPSKYYEDWVMHYDNAMKKHDAKKYELVVQINRIENYINSNNSLPLNFKDAIINFLIRLKDWDYEQAIKSIQNYNNWAKYNLEQENEQKKKADEAVNFWVERVARRVLEICNCIDDLENKMKIRNWSGIIFPLIKIEKYHSFPQKIDDFRFQVKQFCLDMIEKIIKKNPDVDNLTAKQLSKSINMSVIVLHILGEYPKLKIHIPTIEGPLLRGIPDDSYYKEWEVINNGSSTSSTKSGGQTLMAQLIILSMLMRQRADDHSWLFLVSDNPFGTMSAPELVEAVFSLLELLKIQWLVVAPPITNIHITSKFNTVYQMDVAPDEGKLVKVLEKRNRKFLQQINILNPEQYKL
ncbi:hypothetical protein [Clostridium sp. YIM B02500]|uniref:hypothetical protein n=1 Tax=Clostridium sp. YIM B02500 TaxID=2910681 RepID=UPI001EEEDCCA|nr:hypothetical protein [Clostridium sp. YIM B02500]